MYGYLKPDDKKLVDNIVRELAGDERICALYKEWCKLQDDILGTEKDCSAAATWYEDAGNNKFAQYSL